MNSQSVKKWWGLVIWSFIRYRYLLPVFSIVQGLLAIAVVYGLAMMTSNLDKQSSIYLSSGAITLGMIAVGCQLAPQTLNMTKQNGVFDYQKTLPVSRFSILLADLTVWWLASLPGIFMSCLATNFRFHLPMNLTIGTFLLLFFFQIVLLCLGISIAYIFSPNVMGLITQIIMIGGLLFSPITYPPNRLPQWTENLYQVFPFVPISKIIRTVIFKIGRFSWMDLFIISIWGITSFALSVYTLSRRR